MPYLFTYGSLRQEKHNHYVLEHLNAKFHADATIQATLVTDTGYSFPAIKEGFGLVSGEVYEVTEEALKSLDFFEGHPTFYQRRSTVTDAGLPVEAYFGTGVINEKPIYSASSSVRLARTRSTIALDPESQI
ncbi:unnamed protein product [Sphagnum jensenii]